jgi:hypothetical protein
MAAQAKVLGRVLAGRIVAATDMAAFQTDPKMEPDAAVGQALLAAFDRLRKFGHGYRIEMGAFLRAHDLSIATASRMCELGFGDARGVCAAPSPKIARLTATLPR